MTQATRQMTKTGTEKLIAREGTRARMYYDAAGLPTIGVATLFNSAEPPQEIRREPYL